uniref:(California timema) hypothetical protein n=1 Tax=Timema californicum TaxID=61474 RepID=A0A7R9JGY1_TIMCA|nr:unnamed protein product [Timema californicum]
MATLWAVKMTRNVELSTNINSTWEGCYLNALDVMHIDPQFNPCFHTISTRVLMELLAGFSAVILGKIILLLIGVVKIGRKVALVAGNDFNAFPNHQPCPEVQAEFVGRNSPRPLRAKTTIITNGL